ncbi:MAG: hypothetical protein JWQ01_4825 [Massilia sp.]|nr:hypothetical protein [Massilia sp.]
MATDRELLELAAKAAGIALWPGDHWRDTGLSHWLLLKDGRTVWNSLTQDGDALRLAVALHMALTFTVHGDAHAEGRRDEYAFEESPDAAANARRAITRCAAEIERAK